MPGNLQELKRVRHTPFGANSHLHNLSTNMSQVGQYLIEQALSLEESTIDNRQSTSLLIISFLPTYRRFVTTQDKWDGSISVHLRSSLATVDILGRLVHVYLILPHCQVVSCWACTTERRGGEVRFGSVVVPCYTMLYYTITIRRRTTTTTTTTAEKGYCIYVHILHYITYTTSCLALPCLANATQHNTRIYLTFSLPRISPDRLVSFCEGINGWSTRHADCWLRLDMEDLTKRKKREEGGRGGGNPTPKIWHILVYLLPRV